jgi:hypothetical protein
MCLETTLKLLVINFINFIAMEADPRTIQAMDISTMIKIVQEAFNSSNSTILGGNHAFQIVHYLLNQSSGKIVDNIVSFIPQSDLQSWLYVETQFSEKLQLHIMAIGDNSNNSSTRIESLADYLFKTVVDS